tara:strand:- start:8324 stop:8725 length:402 start_codon:yes stop_codon:yes gene_type:complete
MSEVVFHPKFMAAELRKLLRESARARNKKKREDMNKQKLDQPDLDFAHMCLKHDNFGHVLRHIIEYSDVYYHRDILEALAEDNKQDYIDAIAFAKQHGWRISKQFLENFEVKSWVPLNHYIRITGGYSDGYAR